MHLTQVRNPPYSRQHGDQRGSFPADSRSSSAETRWACCCLQSLRTNKLAIRANICECADSTNAGGIRIWRPSIANGSAHLLQLRQHPIPQPKTPRISRRGVGVAEDYRCLKNLCALVLVAALLNNAAVLRFVLYMASESLSCT